MIVKRVPKMQLSNEDRYYNKCLVELNELIPQDDKRRILSQTYCELDDTFMGFINVYKPLSELIPKSKIVIDFGCYLAAQSYFFKNHKEYIGVDIVDMERFTPHNAKHYVGTIEEFIKEKKNDISDNNLLYFAICSYVPDFKSTELVRQTFKNVCCYYPGGG